MNGGLTFGDMTINVENADLHITVDLPPESRIWWPICERRIPYIALLWHDAGEYYVKFDHPGGIIGQTAQEGL